MRAGVHPGAGVWQVVAAEDCPSSPMGSRSANSEQPCAVQRAACIAAPLQRAARWPPCVPGARGRLHCVCGRVCRARGRSVRGRRDALAPAAVATKRRPVCGQHTDCHCSEGCRHRGTGQPASLRRSRTQRGTAAIHIAVFPEDAALVRRCVPMKKSCN